MKLPHPFCLVVLLPAGVPDGRLVEPTLLGASMDQPDGTTGLGVAGRWGMNPGMNLGP